MRHLTKTNKHFLLVGLTFLATSLIFYILAWLGQPSLENTLVNVSSIAFTLGVVTYILLGLIVFFIWDNSMQNGGSSDGFSLLFAETLTPIANKLGFHGNIWTLNRIVRKLAHLTEFTILGSLLYTILRRYITYGTVIKTIGLGMLIASLDEFIQRFSPGRSSQFSDILIDTVGVVIGILVVKLVYYIRYKRSTFKN